MQHQTHLFSQDNMKYHYKPLSVSFVCFNAPTVMTDTPISEWQNYLRILQAEYLSFALQKGTVFQNNMHSIGLKLHDNILETGSCLQSAKDTPLISSPGLRVCLCFAEGCYSYTSHSNAGRLTHSLQPILGTITGLESLHLKWNNVISSTVLLLLTFAKPSQRQFRAQ